jgi:asparagine synthase (glutamine-hydrolysing)
MVGGCGVIGGGADPVDAMAAHLAWTGEEQGCRYDDANLKLRGFSHRSRAGANPGRAPERDTLVWLWGNVVGYQEDSGYRSLNPVEEPGPSFCAQRYDEDGLDFVSRLNGDFVGVVYDREQSTVSVFTDRLGTWPLYYTETADGAVVFSSHIQSLADYPPVTLEFDEEYVVQHLSYRGGPLGVKTPLRGVEAFPPGTVTTYDLETGTTSRNRYWYPSFSAEETIDSYDAFVDEFVDRYLASVADRIQDRSKRYGILLSGGSDARLVLAAMEFLTDDLDITAYHMADWMSKEARIAERVAMAKGVEFRFLRRDPTYFGDVLERSPRMWNFQQLFNQAWADGFIDDIRSEVDVLFTGHFSDTLFKDSFVPNRYVSLGPIGRRKTPFELPVTSVEEYVEKLGPRKAWFVDSDVDLAEVVERNVTVNDDGTVESYGVEFDSFRDFVLGQYHVPATSDPLFRQSLRENLEHRMPMYDNRLLDLWMATPTRYNLRRNVVNSAIARIDPELAEIPHASSGIPVGRSTLLHKLGKMPMNALRRLSPFDAVPAAHVNNNPWGNHPELIRQQAYVEEAIHGNEDLVRSLPFLDWDAVIEVYQDHLDGANHRKLLYRLVTFLEAPVTREIATTGDGTRTELPVGTND